MVARSPGDIRVDSGATAGLAQRDGTVSPVMALRHWKNPT